MCCRILTLVIPLPLTVDYEKYYFLSAIGKTAKLKTISEISYYCYSCQADESLFEFKIKQKKKNFWLASVLCFSLRKKLLEGIQSKPNIRECESWSNRLTITQSNFIYSQNSKPNPHICNISFCLCFFLFVFYFNLIPAFSSLFHG